MTDDVRNISINVDATKAIRQLTKVAVEIDYLGASTGKSDRELRKLDRQLLVAQGTANNAARALGRLKNEMNLMGKNATESKNTILALEKRLDSANRRNAALKTTIQDLRTANKNLTNDNQRLGASFDRLGAQTTAGTNALVRGAKSAKSAMANLDQNFQMNALRYALYDVAGNLTLIAAAGTLAFKNFFQTGIEFERNFANVIRTSQTTGREIDLLREAFLDLQSTIPVTSEELTRIGTLAAQMGIAASQVANFTEVTAKFASVSGISADEAATSLARVGQMLSEDVQGDYERLASAILKTGVNAIATEQQIVRGTTQIASIGKVAGFSAQEIIALSSAMSSLGMSPELQRSVITMSFTKILTAVRGSAEEAAKFGAILGMTGEQFQKAWEGDGYNTYRQLLTTIAESPKAIGILQDLGLATQRLTPNLLKLGQANALLGQTLEDTNAGWEEDTELQRQYQIIMDTTASKLQVLGQAWDAFITVVGSDAVEALGDFATYLRDALTQYREFAQTDGGKFVTALVIGLGAIITIGSAVLTFITLAGAGFLGFDFVVRQLGTSMAAGTGLLGGFKARLDAVTASSAKARTAISLLSIAGRALGVVFAALAVVEIAPGILKGAREMTGIIPDLKDAASAITEFNKVQIRSDLGLDRDTSNWFDRFGTLAGYDPKTFYANEGNFFFDVTGLNNVVDSTKKYDEALAALVMSGNAAEAGRVFSYISDELIKQGADPAETLGYFRDYMAALGMETGTTAEELERYNQGLEEAATAEDRAAVGVAALAGSLGLMVNDFQSAEDALDNFVSAFKTGAGSFFDIGALLEQAYGTEDGQGGGLARFQEDLDGNLVSARTWADGLGTLIQRGAGSVAQAFAEQGPAAQQAISEALALGPEALASLEQSMADAAFFASDAYANAFASQNGVLAQVYKQMLSVDPTVALDAVHAVRDALTEGGGFIDATTLAQLQSEFGFDLDLSLVPTINTDDFETAEALIASTIKPVKIPGTIDVGGLTDVTTQVDAWIVEMEGHSLTLPVDPNTEEGRALIQEWRDTEYATPVSLTTFVNTSTADAQLYALRDWWNDQTITFKVATSYAYNSGSVGGIPGSASGSLVKNSRLIRNNYPGYAAGTSLLRGPGSGTSDSMLVRVSNGEAITKARAVRYYGPKMMDDINNLRFPRFANGGFPMGSPVQSRGATGPQVNVEVNQYNPVTRDPLKQLREDSENVVAGLWGGS